MSARPGAALDRDVKRYFFESPLVRLMSDHDYGDVFVDGEDLVTADRPDCMIPYRSIIIYRYYDEASKDFGIGETPIEHFAKGLGTLILRLRDKVGADPKNAMAAGNFRVYPGRALDGRADLPRLPAEHVFARRRSAPCVDKQNSPTPRRTSGIDIRIVRNVPGWLSFGDANNFNRERMAAYLAVPPVDDVSVVKKFPA
ncbi:MAG: hypothetical protein IPL29_07455 [Propionivibrio sp.]|nr:hypothetical protein [Propionivibrio sp.]